MGIQFNTDYWPIVQFSLVEEVNDEQADGEYSPPPLFAIGENNLNQY